MKKTPSPVPAAATAGLTRGVRTFVYATATVTGAAIMVIEILGAKMLSPFIGMSHFVWTAQIAVTLVALACGYYAGGRLADRSQNLDRLYWAILGAALYLVAAMFVIGPVAYWCLDLNLALGSLLASAVLFFVPLGLLAMTGPFLVRVITASVTGVGGNVGRLTAVSTLGSFAGTLAIGYVLIPLLPNSVSMFATALVLALVCAVYFLAIRKQAVKPLLGIALVAGIGALAVWQSQQIKHSWVVERFRGNSHFGTLQVIDNTRAGVRFYLNDNLVQNTYDIQARQSQSLFTFMLSTMARVYTTNIQDALCIGLGIGIVPSDFARQGAKVDVVEINPAVLPVGQQYFDFKPEGINIVFDDARHFLNRCEKKYDVVVLDAFLGDSSPSHLMTREAFASMKRVLRPGGCLVINSFGEFGPRDFFPASLSKTLKAVFPSVVIHPSGSAVFFTASLRDELQPIRPPDFETMHPDVKGEARLAFATLAQEQPDHGRILTDDYNPVEFYDARNREEIRRRLALAAKEM